MLKEFDVIGRALPSGCEASSLAPDGKPDFAFKALVRLKNLQIAQDSLVELVIGIGGFFSRRGGARQVAGAAAKPLLLNTATNEFRVLVETHVRFAGFDKIAALRDLRAPLKFIRTYLKPMRRRRFGDAALKFKAIPAEAWVRRTPIS
ncbi:MAG: hypothetical protein OXC26_18785 [Albidovulum sp.]|nr:hypothetical protein [Albidovulum sp.]